MLSRLFGKKKGSRLEFTQAAVEVYISILEKILRGYQFHMMQYLSNSDVDELRNMVLGSSSILKATEKEINRVKRESYIVDDREFEVFLSRGNKSETVVGKPVYFYMIKDLYTLSHLNPIYPDDWSQRSAGEKDHWWNLHFMWVVQNKVPQVQETVDKLKSLLEK